MGQIFSSKNYHKSSSIDIKSVLKKEDYGATFTSEEKVRSKNELEWIKYFCLKKL